MDKNREKITTIFFACAIVLGINLLMYAVCEEFLRGNSYNTFAKQSVAWLGGNLDLGQDYPWLELAIYEGKYYVSFPPFPSYFLLPFAFFFGENTPDNLITTAFTIVGVAFCVKIALEYKVDKLYAMGLSVLLYSASAVMQITLFSGVWFFAQNMALTLTLMSFYYAKKGKKGLSTFLLCAAFGCRPFQIFYLPVVVYVLTQNMEETSFKDKLKKLIVHKIYVYIPAVILAISFMALNFARFSNVFEFGRKYLPEFYSQGNIQFGFENITRNFFNLFTMPTFSHTEGLVIPQFNGMNIFISYPIIIWYLYLVVKLCVEQFAFRKQNIENNEFYSTGFSTEKIVNFLIFGALLVHIISLISHSTMGGYHYGNRYVIDALPSVFIGACSLHNLVKKKCVGGFVLLSVFGLAFHVIGMYTFYS